LLWRHWPVGGHRVQADLGHPELDEDKWGALPENLLTRGRNPPRLILAEQLPDRSLL